MASFRLATPTVSAAFLLALSAFASGCDEEDDDPSHYYSCAAPALDDRPATWPYISAAILQPSCATVGCHSELTATAGIQLHSAVAGYTALVSSGVVVPGRPHESRLMHLLRGETARTRMPPDSPLPTTDADLIRRWICAGAEAE